MTLYLFLYNPCIYESAFQTMSVHLSKEGAEKAMIAHKARLEKEFYELHPDSEKRFPLEFGMHESWIVNAIDARP